MFVDASVIVAILGLEDDWESLLAKLESSVEQLYVSPLVRYEAVQALARKQTVPTARPTADTIAEASAVFDALVARMRIEEMSVSAPIGRSALKANARYGKLVGHPAALNFGDCFAYACAKSLGVPLIYKGSDFTHTDLA